jgi:ribosomal protein S12 methylthiotransferase accessory factor YcaO
VEGVAGVREDAVEEAVTLRIRTVDVERITRRAMMSDRRKPSIRVDKDDSTRAVAEAVRMAMVDSMRGAAISVLRKFSCFL